MIDLAIGRGIRPLYETDIYAIEQWCKDYEVNNLHPVPVLKRYIIALYQIQQGTNWKDMGLNKYESYCAAFLHFMMCATKMETPWDANWMVTSILDVEKSYYAKEAALLLDNISKAGQQLFYYDALKATNYSRKSRYSPEKLGFIFGDILKQVIAFVPVEYRRDGLYQASLIMTGKL